MSEEATTPEAAPVAQGQRPPIEKKVSVEVATNSQEQSVDTAPDVNQLVSESRKYRKRAQSSEAELAKLQKQIANDREKQMESQNEWQALAEERAARISELEPIVAQAKEYETQTREAMLADLSNEDRDMFGDLPLPKLRAIHAKLTQNNQRLAVANNPAVPVNEVPEDWTKLSRDDRVKNWDKIVARYRK